MSNEVSAQPNPISYEMSYDIETEKKRLKKVNIDKIEDAEKKEEEKQNKWNNTVASLFDFNGDGIVNKNELNAARRFQKEKNMSVIREAVSLFDYNNNGRFDEEEYQAAMKCNYAKNGDTLSITKQNESGKDNIEIKFTYNDLKALKDYRIYDDKLTVREGWTCDHKGFDKPEIDWGKNGKGKISFNLMDKKNDSLDITDFNGKYAFIHDIKNVNITNSKFSQKLGMYDVRNLNLKNTDIDLVTVDGLKNIELDNSKINTLTNSYHKNDKFNIVLKNGSKKDPCGIGSIAMQILQRDNDHDKHYSPIIEMDSFLSTSEKKKEYTYYETQSRYNGEVKQDNGKQAVKDTLETLVTNKNEAIKKRKERERKAEARRNK